MIKLILLMGFFDIKMVQMTIVTIEKSIAVELPRNNHFDYQTQEYIDGNEVLVIPQGKHTPEKHHKWLFALSLVKAKGANEAEISITKQLPKFLEPEPRTRYFPQQRRVIDRKPEEVFQALPAFYSYRTPHGADVLLTYASEDVGLEKANAGSYNYRINGGTGVSVTYTTGNQNRLNA